MSSYKVFVHAMVLGCLSLSWGCAENTPFSAKQTTIKPEVPNLDAGGDVVKTFSAGSLESVDLHLDSGFNAIRQGFALHQAPKQQELLTQIDRPMLEDSYVQGHSGIDAIQNFSVAEAGVFDLLLVIDNSDSMKLYQKRLAQTLPDILRHISNTNWRIAVTTTSSPCLTTSKGGRRFLTRADYDADPVKADTEFREMIEVGDTGSTKERGILTATSAMREEGCSTSSNKWLRPDSERAILLLTDEKNCGSADNEGCPGDPDELAQYFFSKVGYDVTVNALLLLQEPPSGDENDDTDPYQSCQKSGAYTDPPNPVQYMNMVQETGGLVSDICRSDFSEILDQISQNVARKINVKFELQHPAELNGLSLAIDGKKVNSFNVNGQTLTILDPLTDRSGQLEVHYKHSPVPMVREFLPTSAFDPDTFEVTVNGASLAAADYKLNSANGKVELKNLPPEHASVKIRYRTDTLLRKVFAYTQDFVDGSLEVTVDGKSIQDFSYDASARKVTLNKAPRDAQQVKLSYELAGDKKLEYPVLGVFAHSVESFELKDKATGESLAAVLDGSTIRVPREAVADGREVEAVYNLNYELDGHSFVLAIDELPFPGTLKIDAAGDAGVCAHNLAILDSKLSFSCSDEDFDSIAVSYQYAADYQNTFDIAIDYSGPKSYRVYINGQETSAYHILGDKLVLLKKDLPPDAEVKVLIHPEAS